MRQLLKKEFESGITDKEIYFVGLNASNTKKVRKIVWAGKDLIKQLIDHVYYEDLMKKYMKKYKIK